MPWTLSPLIGSECSGESRRVLAFEAWDRGSHAAVRHAISTHGSWNWSWKTLPAGNWRWRLRLGAADLADEIPEDHFDAIFATSMVSLADLAALLPRRLASTPRVLYMHENQAAYPAAPGRGDPRDAHAVATNLVSMLAADQVIWNSQWNLESFMEESQSLLAAAGRPCRRDILREIAERSRVIWPPVELANGEDREVLHKASEARNRGLTLVAWPHRWEHDKGPEELLELEQACGERLRIGWVLLGEQFRSRPPEFDAMMKSAGDRIIHAGQASRDVYLSWLHAADWVTSTARHEFFGIAVVEALLAGCLPWLPERLSYPELVPEIARGLSPHTPPQDEQQVIAAIREHLNAARAPNAVRRLEAAMGSCLPHARR